MYQSKSMGEIGLFPFQCRDVNIVLFLLIQ